jgi:glycosyltransferase involved in cell wall biosynthesis
MFLAQDYQNCELLIVDDGLDCIGDIVPSLPGIRCIRVESSTSLGDKRNIACEEAAGKIILHWDDDDWYAPWRIRYQVHKMHELAVDLCGVDRVFFVDARISQAWEYIHSKRGLPWLCGASLCYRKAFWHGRRFASLNDGEDSRFVFTAPTASIGVLEDNRFLVARVHAGNTCSNLPVHGLPRRPIEMIRNVVGSNWEQLFGGPEGLPIAAGAPEIYVDQRHRTRSERNNEQSAD